MIWRERLRGNRNHFVKRTPKELVVADFVSLAVGFRRELNWNAHKCEVNAVQHGLAWSVYEMEVVVQGCHVIRILACRQHSRLSDQPPGDSASQHPLRDVEGDLF